MEEVMETNKRMAYTALEYLMLTVATLVLVIGVYVFKFPNNFSFGGVTGISVILGAVLPFSPSLKNYSFKRRLRVEP